MDRPPLEVADLVRAAGDACIQRSRKWITWKHGKVLLAIVRCRTAALGGHLDECTRCGHRAISYNYGSPFPASLTTFCTTLFRNSQLPRSYSYVSRSAAQPRHSSTPLLPTMEFA